MARMRFGGGPQDVYLFADVEGDMHAGGAFNAVFYDGPTEGAAALTDLLDATGNPITYITTSDGTDGRAVGQLPIFFGPDNLFEMWVSINDEPRQIISANNVGSYYAPVKTQVDSLLNSGNPNPTNVTLGSLIGIDATSLDAAPTGSTLVKQPGGLYGAGGAPVPLADTIWVAASNAPPAFVSAQYICDGVNDEVQIQQALDNALGMRVGLSPGTFNLSGTVNLYGPDNATQVLSRYLIGSGQTQTKLVVGSSLFTGLNLSKGVSAHIWDLTVQISGAARGIYFTATATPGANYTAAINSSIRRVTIQGPGDGTTTNYALGVRTAIQCTVEDVTVTGCNYGILVRNEQGAHTTQNVLVRRCSINLTGNNSIGLRIDADAGATRAVTVQDVAAFVDPIYTGTTGFSISPTGEASGIKMMNVSARNFGTVLLVGANAYEVDAQFGFVEMRNAGIFASVAGFASRATVSEMIVPSSFTSVTIMTDTNADATMVNEYSYHINAPGTTTLNGTLGNGVVTRGVVEGSATLSAALTRNPGNFIDRTSISLTKVTSAFGTTGSGFGSTTGVVRTSLDGKLVYVRISTRNTNAITATNDNITDQLIFTVDNAAYRPSEDVSSVWSSGAGTGEAGFNPSGQIYIRTSDASITANSEIIVYFMFLKD
jgi:hypothetical protein